MLDSLSLGSIDIMTPLGGGALQLPIGLWEPGSLSAHKGHFGAGATAIPFTASLVAGHSITSPLTFNSIGLNNHVGIYNITGSEIVVGSNIKLGALEATYTAIFQSIAGLFSNIVPKATETTPASTNNSPKGDLNGVWFFNGIPLSVEPDNTSDIRLKKNIKRLDDLDCLNKIMELNPVSYDWREEKLPSAFLNEHRDEDDQLKRQVGLIAQEVEKYIPELTGSKTIYNIRYKSIKYDKLTALLVGALQEQQKEIGLLKTRITTLEN
jgi:hypothetical protein